MEIKSSVFAKRHFLIYGLLRRNAPKQGGFAPSGAKTGLFVGVGALDAVGRGACPRQGSWVLWICNMVAPQARYSSLASPGGRQGRPRFARRAVEVARPYGTGFLQSSNILHCSKIAVPSRGQAPRPTMLRRNHITTSKNPIAAGQHNIFSFFIAPHSAAQKSAPAGKTFPPRALLYIYIIRFLFGGEVSPRKSGRRRKARLLCSGQPRARR